jgi:hypothetical protein
VSRNDGPNGSAGALAPEGIGPVAPRQEWATDGVAPMEHPGWIARLFMAVVAFSERLNLRCAQLGNP